MTATEVTDRQRLSAIAHTGSTMWGPIAAATADEIVDRVAAEGIGSGGRVIDLGCGPAELLRRVVERTNAHGVAIDASTFALDEARRRLARSRAADRIELVQADVRELEPRGDADVAICVGPGWPAGGWRALTAWTARFVRTGGIVVLGEGAWAARPAPKTLERLDMTEGEYVHASEVIASVASAGVEPIWSRRATSDEWSAYADAYRSALRSFAGGNGADPLTSVAEERSGPGWAFFELLHEALDFVVVVGRTR